MYWERMSIDEYAHFQRANGMKLVQSGGRWWTETGPFFFRPLFPFTEIHPHASPYPLRAQFGGVQHAVPCGAHSNTAMRLFVYDELKEYRLGTLSEKRRGAIKRGLKHFHAQRITDAAELGADAYEMYLSFYQRTHYGFKQERLSRPYFDAWAQMLFRFPKVVVIGAYQDRRLAAVSISYLVDQVIIDGTFFSDTQSQKLQVSDFMVHTLREAAAFSDAAYIYRGMPTGNNGLDEAKLSRGCKLLQKPAFYRANPLALSFVKTFMPDRYQKIIGRN